MIEVRMTNRGNLTLWWQALYAVIALGSFVVVGAAFMDHQYLGCVVMSILGGIGLYQLAQPVPPAGATRRTIEPGEYPVYMLRVLGEEVIVVAGIGGDRTHAPELYLYLLPRQCFKGNLRPFIDKKVGLVMMVTESFSAAKIQLRHVPAGLRIITAETQHDPA